jgi:hypothetical protein
MELDTALRRQALLTAYAQKAIALSLSAAGGLLARRAALVIDRPDAYFARMLASLMEGKDGLGSLTVMERTFGILPFDSWGVLAALSEYTGTPNPTVEELYEAAARSSFRDASGQPSVSKDYMTVFELMARADGDEAPFNVERVFNGLTGAIEQVGLGAVPEWNTLWRTALTKSLQWKAASRDERAALDEIMELLGAFSLSEATAQQIKSVYSQRSGRVNEKYAQDHGFESCLHFF